MTGKTNMTADDQGVAGAATVDRDPFRYRRAIARRIAFCLLVLVGLVGGVGGWAATAELAGAVIAHGTVVVDSHVKAIQHREGGIVSQIRVRNGDRVAAGTTIVRLDETQVRAELAMVEGQLAELGARHARLVAERDLAGEVVFPIGVQRASTHSGILAGEARLFKEARAARESQKEQLSFRVRQLEDEIKGLSGQHEAKRRELGLVGKELGEVRGLFARKLTQASRLYSLEREETRLAGEHANLAALIARAGGQISETRLQLINIDQTARAEAQRALREVEARMAELTERDVAARDRLVRLDIRSPVAGVIHELKVHTIEGVVGPGDTIATVVPAGEALSVEIQLSPVEVDRVHVGQVVRLRFTSFNQRTTPEQAGRITYLAADISSDPRTGMSTYTARVRLDDPAATSVAGQPIVPGMPVEAFIQTQSRTVLSYLAKPIADHLSRALREE